jgi:hypothetical protein
MNSKKQFEKAAADGGWVVKKASYAPLVHGEAWPVSGGWTVTIEKDGKTEDILGWDAAEVIDAINDIANPMAHTLAPSSVPPVVLPPDSDNQSERK